MGGKQWKKGKHLLFYGACFLIVFLTIEGCIVPSRRVQVLPDGGTPVERAYMLVSKGNYNGALKAFGKIVRSYPHETPGDRALFEMGLIWVYPDNPKKNYDEALKYFKKLLHDFPRSPLKKEASAWVDVINNQARYGIQIKDLESKILSRIEQINMYKEEISRYKEEVSKYQNQISSYKDQISALKEIDIGIEEKKRKGSPEE